MSCHLKRACNLHSPYDLNDQLLRSASEQQMLTMQQARDSTQVTGQIPLSTEQIRASSKLSSDLSQAGRERRKELKLNNYLVVNYLLSSNKGRRPDPRVVYVTLTLLRSSQRF